MSLDHHATVSQRPKKGLFARFLARRDGATAIEISLLCLPFFMIVFASIETFIAFTGEQMLANATDTMARKIRTGEIRSTMSEENFRAAFCEEIAITMRCSPTEIKKADKLFIDVRSFAKFSEIPKTVPLKDGDLDPTSFKFLPGGKRSINIVRAYYRWDVMTDLIRPYISNIRSADGSRQNYLMIATAVVQNEDYQ